MTAARNGWRPAGAVVLVALALAGHGVLLRARPQGGYQDLVTLFREWRAFQKPKLVDGVPDYSAAAMAAGRVTVRRPASVLGSPITHRPPIRRTDRSMRSRPPVRTSDRRSAVASPKRSPPNASTSTSAP